jgi:hypothetical protein
LRYSAAAEGTKMRFVAGKWRSGNDCTDKREYLR